MFYFFFILCPLVVLFLVLIYRQEQRFLKEQQEQYHRSHPKLPENTSRGDLLFTTSNFNVTHWEVHATYQKRVNPNGMTQLEILGLIQNGQCCIFLEGEKDGFSYDYFSKVIFPDGKEGYVRSLALCQKSNEIT